MSVIDTRFAAMLKGDRTLVGMFCGMNAPCLLEMAGYAGFDFVVIDNEHGPANPESIENLVRTAKSAGIPPLVRIGSYPGQQEILRVLDSGASGIQVPQVNNAESLQSVVQAAKYPPVGKRGTAFSPRAAGYGFFGGPAHLETSNSSTVIVSQVETVEALDNLDEVLKVPGVDVFFVGPNDLAVSMGYEGNFNHPDVQAVIERTLKKIAAAGLTAGILASNGEEYRRYEAWGARYMLVTVNTLIIGAMRSYLLNTRR